MKPEIEVLSAKIAAHLTQQKRLALAPRGAEDGTEMSMRCSYRGKDGSSCAVGCLIDDGHYKSWLEGKFAGDSFVIQAIAESQDVEPAILGGAIPILSRWQQYHDSDGSISNYYANWVEGKTGAQSPTEFHELLKELF